MNPNPALAPSVGNVIPTASRHKRAVELEENYNKRLDADMERLGDNFRRLLDSITVRLVVFE
jgi:hypothetical protein